LQIAFNTIKASSL